MAAPSFQNFYDLGRAEAIIRESALTFNEGDISDMFMAAAAAMADRLTGYAANRFRATFLDGAQGDDLTVLANDHWGIVRNPAVKATGAVTLSRLTFAGGAGAYFAGSIVATEKDALGNDIQYTLDSDAVFGATDLSQTVNVTAVIADRDGNANTGTVVKLITPPFDLSLTVTNAAPIAGGADEESDEALRDRVRGFPLTLRRGTLAALEYGAKTIPGVVNAHAVESNSGITTVYVADINGNSNPTMVANVTAEIENWRAAGSLVFVAGGVLYAGPGTNGPGQLIIELALTVRTGVDVTALIADIKAALIASLDKLQPGETVYRSQLQRTVINVSPVDIVDVDVITPAANLAPGPDELIRTTAADISIT